MKVLCATYSFGGYLSLQAAITQTQSEGMTLSREQGDNTALHWAAMRGHVEIVKYLLQQHADREMQNKQGKLPIDLCQPTWSNSYRYTREVLAS